MRTLTTGTVILLGLAAVIAAAAPGKIQAPAKATAFPAGASIRSAAEPTVFEMVSRKYREWANALAAKP